MFNEASPSPLCVFIPRIEKNFFILIQNTSAVQVNNHSFNQPSAAINQPGEMPECMQKHYNNKQTKLPITRKTKTIMNLR
jgi:hypothetical protein